MSQGGRRGLAGAELDEAESLVGRTPLMPLRRLPNRPDIKVWGKLESFNPGGSAKDRTALAMLRRGCGRALHAPIGSVPFCRCGLLPQHDTRAIKNL